MNKDLKEYVYLDGMWLQEKQLLKLAMNVGSFQLAEHYLCALLFNAVIKGKRDVLFDINKVREHYGVAPIPLGDEDVMDEKDLRGKTRVSTEDLQARKIFLKLDREARLDILRSGMNQLLSDYNMFFKRRHWLSVFMVIRDRLVGESISQKNFVDLANEFTPESLPKELMMSTSIMKNFSREISEEDRGEVYYKMKYNPQQCLCDTFWDILKNTILTII